MFKCQKCNEERYMVYEESIYKCMRCKYLLRICCDCVIEQQKNNNLEILKNELSHLFKHIIDIKIIISKIIQKKKLPPIINIIVLKYLNFRYIDILNKSYYSNKINYNVQYINPFGLQLKNDDGKLEYYSNPVFCCIECLKKYNYYSIEYNKLDFI